jgi:hypothetical protein
MLKMGNGEELFVRNAKRVNTWGVFVKEGKEIKKGVEILLKMAFIIDGMTL